jgi:hypothetical protein
MPNLPYLASGDWVCGHPWPSGWITAPGLKDDRVHVADVRGWGYLIGGGHGALGLKGDVAAASQDAWGSYMVRAVNCHDELASALRKTTGLLRDYALAAGPLDEADTLALAEAECALQRASQ